MRKAGFTLIEVMIALSIVSIVMAMVYASFATVTRAVDASRASAEELRLRQFLAQNLHANFSSAYDDGTFQEPLFLFTGTRGDSSSDGAADVVEFCTTTALVGGMGLPGDLKRVRYEVVTDEPSEGEAAVGPGAYDPAHRRLVSTETPILASGLQLDTSGDTPQSETSASFDAPSWSVPVSSFEVRYFDGSEWVDTWDSQQAARLPWCVMVRVNFARTDEERDAERQEGIDSEKDADFELVVPIALGEAASEAALGAGSSDSANGDNSQGAPQDTRGARAGR